MPKMTSTEYNRERNRERNRAWRAKKPRVRPLGFTDDEVKEIGRLYIKEGKTATEIATLLSRKTGVIWNAIRKCPDYKKKPILKTCQELIDKAWKLYKEDHKLVSEIVEEMGVSKFTVYRWLAVNPDYSALAAARSAESNMNNKSRSRKVAAEARAKKLARQIEINEKTRYIHVPIVDLTKEEAWRLFREEHWSVKDLELKFNLDYDYIRNLLMEDHLEEYKQIVEDRLYWNRLEAGKRARDRATHYTHDGLRLTIPQWADHWNVSISKVHNELQRFDYSFADVAEFFKGYSNRLFDHNIYTFIKGVDEFTGTRQEFMNLHQIVPSLLSNLINGRIKHAKGWSVKIGQQKSINRRVLKPTVEILRAKTQYRKEYIESNKEQLIEKRKIRYETKFGRRRLAKYLENKSSFLSLIKEGKERPTQKEYLGQMLSAYTKIGSRSFRLGLKEELISAGGEHWFPDFDAKYEANKATFLKLISEKKPRPNKRSTDRNEAYLAHSLGGYLKVNGDSYRPGLKEELISAGGGYWFKIGTRVRK